MSQVQEQSQYTQQSSSEQGALILPYAAIGGVRNLPDNVILAVYKKMKEQGLVDTVFHDGSVSCADQFLKMMQNDKNLPLIAHDNSGILGIAWLNDIAGNRALGHFCFFKEAWGKKSKNVGNKILEYWFSLQFKGKPIFDVIIGNTPSSNKHALSFIKKIGFTIVGEIPHVGFVSYVENNQNGQQGRRE